MPTWNRNISMRALRVFCAASETESFRAAADKLFLTSSAVSHQIKHLESEFGQTLFVRSTRALALTDFGQRLFAELQPILADLDRVIAKNCVSARSHSLQISVQPFFASEMLVPQLHSFGAQHPDIDINIDATSESSTDQPQVADISIRIFNSPPQGQSCDRLFPLCLIPAGSPDFYDTVKVIGRRISSDFPLIVHDSRPAAWRQWEKSARLRVPHDAPRIQFDSMTDVLRAAERGMGAALVPLQSSRNWFENGNLVQLFDHQLVTSEAYYLVCHHAEPQTEPVQAFREWVLQNFANE